MAHESPILAGLGEQDGVQTKICNWTGTAKPPARDMGLLAAYKMGAFGSVGQLSPCLVLARFHVRQSTQPRGTY